MDPVLDESPHPFLPDQYVISSGLDQSGNSEPCLCSRYVPLGIKQNTNALCHTLLEGLDRAIIEDDIFWGVKEDGRIGSPMKEQLIKELVEFVTGRGGAGFHSLGPAITMGRGGYYGGNPRPAPVRYKSPLIAWMGPRFSPPVLTGAVWGTGGGGGSGREP